jgi:hypothetical protein
MRAMNKTILMILLILFSASLTAQIKVTNSGSVGIKTMYPLKDFQVIGNSVFSDNTGKVYSSAYIQGNNNYSTTLNPDFTWYNNDQTGFFHPSSNVIGFTVNGNERARLTISGLQINSSGNWTRSIFVNATHPNACGYHMHFGGSDNFFVHASGWIYSQGQFLGSDASFKKDINTITDALGKVLLIRGVTYKLNYTGSMSVYNTDKVLMGVVAQEIEPIVPEVVKTMPNGTKAVAYQNLVALLIEAIKEQQIQIDYLEKSIGTLRDNSSSNTQDELNGFNDEEQSIDRPKLYQNQPNPFNKTTIIRYTLSDNTQTASILIFDLQGTLIMSFKNLSIKDGQIKIKNGELNPGMYIYSLIVNEREVDTKRMILTK